jgi:phage shock protein C
MSMQEERRTHGEPEMPGRRRLYRDSERGMILGVCAGVADYFGFDLGATRIATALALVFFTPATLLTYFILGFLLPKKPPGAYVADAEKAELTKSVRSSPHATLSMVRHRMRELELKMQRMERYVTSDRFRLDREFRDLQSKR